MSYRVIFCGTPEFSIPSLRALHQDPDFEILCVFTQPDRPQGRGNKLQACPVKEEALRLGLRVESPEKISTLENIQMVQELNCDLAIVVAFGQILSQKFLDAFKKGVVNIHSSLLPRWRGAAPMQRAIMEGDQNTGVSLQKVIKKLDAGDVIGERKIELTINMGAIELHDQLSVLGAELLLTELKSFLKGEIIPHPQDPTLVTHAQKIEKSEAQIDWSQSAFRIHNKIRGLNRGGPFAQAHFKGQSVKIHQSYFVSFAHQQKCGEVLNIGPQSFLVACGQDALEVLVVQPQNKAKMSAADFCRGFRLQKGDFFE